MYRLGRRSLVAAKKIAKGIRIQREMLEVKRPGFGIPTKMMDTVIGRVAKVDIDEDDILDLNPSFTRNMTPPSGGSYELRVPVGKRRALRG